jgi:hypothetical protein
VQRLYPSTAGTGKQLKFIGLRLQPTDEDDEEDGVAASGSIDLAADLLNRKFSRKVH